MKSDLITRTFNQSGGYTYSPLDPLQLSTAQPNGPPNTQGVEYALTFVWHQVQGNNPTNIRTEWRINGKKENVPPANEVYNYARPSSYHPGGVVATFADKRVVFIREDIEYDVYQQLMTTHHLNSMNVLSPKILNSTDYE